MTGVYSVGASPAVMATVNGNAEYGLVFAQRNKSITYNNVLYVNNVVTAYFDVNGNLNDGSGHLWIDLIPNANAAPADSYYVVTINIQGAVHSEIWIVPDQASASAASVRQASAPSSGGTAPPVPFYQTVQQAGSSLAQRSTLNFTGAGVSCLDNSGLARTDCTITSGGGSGTVSSFSAGTLSPLFATSVATPSTTPALTFTLSNAAAHQFFGNNTGGSGAPTFVQPAFTDISGSVAATQLPNPSASTLGGIQSLAAVGSKWINTISTSGIPFATQPASSDLSDAANLIKTSTTAAGDLSGTFPGPTVAKINGTSIPTNAAADQTIITTASATGAWKAVNNCGDTTHALSYSTTTHAFGCQAITASAAAGGSSGQVQWNNATALGGVTNLTTNGTVTTALAGADWLFADPTDSTKKAQLDLSGITTATTRTVTVANANSTTVVPDAGAANNFLTAISATGAISKAQPSFANISGTVAATQLPNPSATTLGGIQSLAAVTHKWMNTISTSGVPSATQPDYSDLTGVPATFTPSAHNLLSVSHGDATASAAIRGGAIFAIGASPLWAQVAHSGATGGYWKWNGTDVVASTGAASGTGSPTACTNQAVTGFTLNADAAPTSTCATITSASTSGTFPPSAHNLLSSSHGDTAAGTVARGDVLTGQGASPAWTRLAKGTASQCLQMDGTATDIIWGACATGGSGIGTLNTLTATTQTFATGISGTDFNISSATSTHTFNIPDASASARGLLTTGSQTFGGTKTFSEVDVNGAGDFTLTATAANANVVLKPSGSGKVEAIDGTDTAKILKFDVSGNTTGVAGTLATAFTTAKTWMIPDAADTAVGKATADTLTNKTLDAEGTGNLLTIPSKVWFVAASCNNATAAPGFDLPASNAPTPNCQGTLIRTASLDYTDSAVQKAYFNFRLPNDWTGNIDARIKWFSPATTNATTWNIKTGCLADGASDATAGPTLNTAQAVTTNDNATANSTNESALNSLTTTGCVAGRLMYFELSRDNSDTNTSAASLLGVELTIRRAM